MEPEVMKIVSPDGQVCHAVLQLPAGDGPFPGVLVVHGGMGGHTPGEILGMATAEDQAPRHVARQGYAVLTSDYRHPSLAHLEVDDTVAAYEALRRHPGVIADRVAMCGTSHGAVCATYAAMRVRPACVVAEEGATDLAYRYRVLHEQIRTYGRQLDGFIKLDKELWDEVASRLGGPPSAAPEAYEKASAHAQADRICSPFLIVSGDGPYLPHCLQMYAALLKAKKPCQFVLAEGAPHAFWWSRISRAVFPSVDERILGFLARHLKGP